MAAVSASLMLLFTTKPSEIIWAFYKFRLPAAAGLAFTAALRFPAAAARTHDRAAPGDAGARLRPELAALVAATRVGQATSRACSGAFPPSQCRC